MFGQVGEFAADKILTIAAALPAHFSAPAAPPTEGMSHEIRTEVRRRRPRPRLIAGPAIAAGNTVVVASKIDTEGGLLGNMILQVLDHAGIPTENKVQLGPTKIVRTALLSGEVDIYPEYTGNAGFFFNVSYDPAWKNAQKAYEKAKELDMANHIVWLQPAPANNTWAIAVRKDVAETNISRPWKTSASGSPAAAR